MHAVDRICIWRMDSWLARPWGKVTRREVIVGVRTGDSAVEALHLEIGVRENLHSLESSHYRKAELSGYLLVFTLEICGRHRLQSG